MRRGGKPKYRAVSEQGLNCEKTFMRLCFGPHQVVEPVPVAKHGSLFNSR
jgi:hypothetical protein